MTVTRKTTSASTPLSSNYTVNTLLEAIHTWQADPEPGFDVALELLCEAADMLEAVRDMLCRRRALDLPLLELSAEDVAALSYCGECYHPLDVCGHCRAKREDGFQQLLTPSSPPPAPIGERRPTNAQDCCGDFKCPKGPHAQPQYCATCGQHRSRHAL